MNAPDPFSAIFNYMDQTVHPSLHRNGRVLMRRNRLGSDSPMEGLSVEKRDVSLLDARQMPTGQHPTLYRNGFELTASPLAADTVDFLDHTSVLANYYPACEQLVQQATGAARVCAFDHNVRSAAGKKDGVRISGGQEVQGPARMVHGDYTLTSAPQRLRDLTEPPGPNDTLMAVLGADKSLFEKQEIESVLRSGNFAIINVWRSIADEPVQTDPIALCDGQTVEPNDLVVFEIHYEDRVGENYFARSSDKHRWYFYPQMTRDEALLIKQWDSRGPMASTEGEQADHANQQAPCTFSFHSSFANKSAPPDAPSRWSIEVRCIALFPGG